MDWDFGSELPATEIPTIAIFDDHAAEEKWLKEKLAEEQAALGKLELQLAKQREEAEKHARERSERAQEKLLRPRRNPFTSAIALGSSEVLSKLAQSLGLAHATLQAVPGEDGLFALRARRC